MTGTRSRLIFPASILTASMLAMAVAVPASADTGPTSRVSAVTMVGVHNLV